MAHHDERAPRPWLASPHAPPVGASLDGRYVVFASIATNLVVPDANGELRTRTPGPARAGAFRLISCRSGPARTRRVTARMRIPAALAPGTYEERVLMSSARELGTTARTITVP